mmetsp:Transcript_64601/g.178588  ORF Transcript_64601/g.178588 Transcript_64601/m.178588 type:complete len:230 (-) Transcript_64601:202-891(-)
MRPNASGHGLPAYARVCGQPAARHALRSARSTAIAVTTHPGPSAAHNKPNPVQDWGRRALRSLDRGPSGRGKRGLRAARPVRPAPARGVVPLCMQALPNRPRRANGMNCAAAAKRLSEDAPPSEPPPPQRPRARRRCTEEAQPDEAILARRQRRAACPRGEQTANPEAAAHEIVLRASGGLPSQQWRTRVFHKESSLALRRTIAMRLPSTTFTLHSSGTILCSKAAIAN